MKLLYVLLSLCLSLQSIPLSWRTVPALSIQCNHRTQVPLHDMNQLQQSFKDALDQKKESLEISSYLRHNYLSEREALEEVRDAFFSIQSNPVYFMVRPEIRASWQKQYTDEGLGFSSYQVRFETLPEFADETQAELAWKTLTKEIEDLAFQIRSKKRTPAEELELVMELLAKRANYEKTEDQRNNNLYSCLLEGNTQCTGFSQSVYLLVKSLGYPVRIVHGDYEGRYHTWNQVQLQGKWYHLDLTADLDPRDQGYTLQYFLRGDQGMRDHEFQQATQDEDYLEGYQEKGYLLQDEEELKNLLHKLFSTPGTYQIALAKSFDLSFLPSYVEELKESFPYHHLHYQLDAQRMKITIQDYGQKKE